MLSVALSTAGMVQHDLPDLLCSIIASGGSDMLSLLQDLDPQLSSLHISAARAYDAAQEVISALQLPSLLSHM